MTFDNDTLQKSFNSPAHHATARVDIKSLPAMRQKDPRAYSDMIRLMHSPTLFDLETLVPRAQMPQLVDGKIMHSKRDQGLLAGWLRSITKPRTETYEASSITNFLSLIERIERDDPGFMTDYIDSLFSSEAIDFAMDLHVIDKRPDLKEKFLGKTNIDDLVLAAIRYTDETRGYALDYSLRAQANKLGTAYIMRRAPLNTQDYADDEALRPFLEIANDHCYGSPLIEAINTQMPLPLSIDDIHKAGVTSMNDLLSADLELADWMQDRCERYPSLSDEEKLEFGNRYLLLLSQAYGIDPPPSLDIDSECSGDGDQSIWSMDRDECYAHPLGRIRVKTLINDCDDFLETLSHEFVHGLEDCAMLSLNPDFQAWRTENPEVVAVGDETMQKKMCSAALALSFNAVSGFKDAFACKKGAYYSPPADNPQTKDNIDALDKRYRTQLRERHAFGYEGYIRGHFRYTAEMIKDSRDPLHVFMAGQSALPEAQAYIKDRFVPSIPDGMEGSFTTLLTEIKDYFEKAQANEVTIRDRVRYMGRAFSRIMALVADGHEGGFIDYTDHHKDMYDKAENVYKHAVQAIKHIKLTEETGAPRAIAAAQTASA